MPKFSHRITELLQKKWQIKQHGADVIIESPEAAKSDKTGKVYGLCRFCIYTTPFEHEKDALEFATWVTKLIKDNIKEVKDE